MRVLHVIPSVAPVRGGPSQAVLEMVSALRSQGIEADIVTTNDNGPTCLEVPLAQWVDYPVHPNRPETVPVLFFGRYSPAVSAVREFIVSAPLGQWLWQHIRDYDRVHVHAIFSFASTTAMAIARIQGVPYINRPLGQLCTWSLQQSQRRKTLYLQWIERANLQHCAAVHFTSEAEQQEAATALGPLPNPFVIPHGLKVPPVQPQARSQLRQQLNLPVDEPLVTFLSRLHPKKGLADLIPALAQIQRPFTFILAGSGDPAYEAEVDQLLQTTGMQAKTRRLGFVTGALKDLLLQGSDLSVLTSHSENFGVAVLEALAAGIPVVITPQVALADWVERHHAGWVTPKEPSAIATTIATALSDLATAHEMGQQARAAVLQEFSWSAIALQLQAQYQAIAPPPVVPCPSQPTLSTNVAMLNAITPVLLTYNESANLDRTLQKLTWAKRIVIVDSFSTDSTLDIARAYPQVDLFQRTFDTHAQQWNYGLAQVQTPWVLSLDADYQLTDDLIAEMSSLAPDTPMDGFSIGFKYCVFGRPLRGTLLPPRTALFRREKSTYLDDGHTQLIQVSGPVGQLSAPILHDDRKPLSRWLWAQDRYAILEAQKLLATPPDHLSWGDRLRKFTILSPFAVLVYCLILRGGLWDGRSGWYYAFQRVLAEMLLSIRLIELRT